MNSFGILIFCLLILFTPTQSYSQNTVAPDLQQIEEKINSETIALKSLIKKIYPNYAESLGSTKITKLKIISNQCRVRETIDRTSQVIYSPTINEEFRIIGHDDNYFHIKLGGGRDGWIHETCGQVITETVEKKSVQSILSETDINKYLDFCLVVFNKIETNKLLADKIVTNERISKKNSSYKNIQKHFDLAVSIYKKYLSDRKSYIADNFDFTKRISGSTEFLLGKASYNQKYLDGVVNDYEEGNRDFAINGNYILNGDAQVNLFLNSKTEVLQTPYRTTNYGAGFNYSGFNRMFIDTKIHFNSYDDDITSNNDYGRFQFDTNIRRVFSPKSDVNLHYTLLNNNYKIGDDNDYSSHRIAALTNLKLNPFSKMVISFLSSFEVSDSEYHQFRSLKPSISLQRKIGDKRTNLLFHYENLVFEELTLRDYNRLSLSYKVNNKKINKRNAAKFSVGMKSFPNNDIDDYFQIKGKLSSSSIGKLNKQNAFAVYTNIYPNLTDNSYTDFRYDFNLISKMFANFSAYYRLWHNTFESDSDTTSSANPSIVDLNGKLGIKIGPVRIGPTVGIHAILDFDEDEVFKQDGNLIRYGGVAEGTFLLPKMISASFMVAYDFGSVYNDEISIEQSTGEITTGELQERHPTSLQYSATLSAPLVHNLEIVGRLYYYKINTDLDETLSINPIKSTKQLSFQLGIRYNYN